MNSKIAAPAVLLLLVGLVVAPRAQERPAPGWRVTGRVVDDEGKPVQGVNVQVLPADGEVDLPASMTGGAETDDQGRYVISLPSPVDFFLGVHVTEAPTADRPYGRTFYPGVKTRSEAERVHLQPGEQFRAQDLVVSKIVTEEVPVRVYWQDGTFVERSNVRVHNNSFPHQAVIGNVAPQADKGSYTLRVPVGFEYVVSAAVQCDAGEKIVQVESNFVTFVLSTDGPAVATTVLLTVPAKPCKLWQPPR